MNKVFKNTEKIELDFNWSLIPDGYNGIVLIFSEKRERKNKKTGELEDYIYEDRWHHPRISQSLKEYVKLTQNSSKTIDEILEKTDKIYTLLERMDKEFKQF